MPRFRSKDLTSNMRVPQSGQIVGRQYIKGRPRRSSSDLRAVDFVAPPYVGAGVRLKIPIEAAGLASAHAVACRLDALVDILFFLG